MHKKPVNLAEQFLIVGGLQLFFQHFIKASIVPSFFLVWLLILVWEGDREIALFMAVVSGIFYDIISRGIAGVSSIIFLVIVYVNCFLKPSSVAGRFVGTFCFSMAYFFMLLFERHKGFFWGPGAILRYSLLFAFYNGLIAVVIQLGMRKLRWKKKGYLSIL